eukprot:762751-Hanusia_phi.AAC.4
MMPLNPLYLHISTLYLPLRPFSSPPFRLNSLLLVPSLSSVSIELLGSLSPAAPSLLLLPCPFLLLLLPCPFLLLLLPSGQLN